MMIENLGHGLNWLIAALLFPLMLAPLSALFAKTRLASTLSFFVLNLVIVGAGILFAYVTPILRVQPDVSAFSIFVIAALALTGVLYAMGGTFRAITPLTSWFARIVETTGKAVMWLLLIMALVQFAVVLARYIFGINSIFMQESVMYMHGAVFLLAAGYTLLTDDHVRVDIFYRDASPRMKARIDLAGVYLFLFPICLLILWTASPYVARSWFVMEGSNDTSGIQGLYLLKSLIPAFAVFLSMAGFCIAARAVKTIREENR